MDKKELAGLSPENRIKRLKEMEKSIEEEKKQQLEELTTLIKQSMQELRTGKLASEITPQPRKVEMSNLFERPGENELERTARQAKTKQPKPMKTGKM